MIIPLREIIGNYNCTLMYTLKEWIIPLREIIGNYNLFFLSLNDFENYTLERDNRELQLIPAFVFDSMYYTLERDNRELQHRTDSSDM